MDLLCVLESSQSWPYSTRNVFSYIFIVVYSRWPGWSLRHYGPGGAAAGDALGQARSRDPLEKNASDGRGCYHKVFKGSVSEPLLRATHAACAENPSFLRLRITFKAWLPRKIAKTGSPGE